MKLGLIYIFSFLAVLYERFWSAFWPTLSVTALYAGLALMDALHLFGNAGHIALLILFGAAVLLTLARYGRQFRFPTRHDIKRRIEKNSDLSHRPLSSSKDKPVAGLSDVALALWKKHQAQLAAQQQKIHTITPTPDTARQDPYGLRHAAALLLLIGFVVAGDHSLFRLQQSVTPHVPLPAFAQKAKTQFDVWITPPAYTGTAPFFLASSQKDMTLTGPVLDVPEGSMLNIRVSGNKNPGKIRYAGKNYTTEKAGPRSHVLEMVLKESGSLVLRQGWHDLGRWQMNIQPDTAPEIQITETGQTRRGALKITWRAEDDYGLISASGTITPSNEDVSGAPMSLPSDAEDIVTFNIPGIQTGQDNIHTIDLTSHLHAGLPATLTISTEDAAGQIALSEPVDFILPERKFRNPLAQQLISARKKLAYTQTILGYAAVADTLFQLGKQPGLYKGDMVIYLALDIAVRRLQDHPDRKTVRSVQKLLWDVALKLEDGGLTTVARDLSDALQQLSQALDNPDMTGQEMQELMQEVQKAMQAYMQTLARELAQRLARGGKITTLPPELAEKFTKNIDFGQMMKQMQELSQQNSREAMKKMAEMLQNMVENLDVNNIEQLQEEQERAMEALADLQKLIDEQQELMDQTGKSAPDDDKSKLARAQKALRQQLGDIARTLGEATRIPENLMTADQEMKSAAKSLEDQDANGALPHQKKAIDELQDGMEQAVENMAQQMQQIVLSFGSGAGSSGQTGDNYGEGYDPLGREGDGKKNAENVEIPDEAERRRVQEIIRELRNRSNDYQRPKVERDYLDRLLDFMN